MPRRSHHTLSGVSPWSDVEAKGTPLSVRIARGNPYSRKSRSKMGRTPDAPRRQQAVAREQVARVLVGDRQRIAVDPIAGPELAFEVGGPEIIGRVVTGGTTPG